MQVIYSLTNVSALQVRYFHRAFNELKMREDNQLWRDTDLRYDDSLQTCQLIFTLATGCGHDDYGSLIDVDMSLALWNPGGGDYMLRMQMAGQVKSPECDMNHVVSMQSVLQEEIILRIDRDIGDQLVVLSPGRTVTV